MTVIQCLFLPTLFSKDLLRHRRLHPPLQTALALRHGCPAPGVCLCLRQQNNKAVISDLKELEQQIRNKTALRVSLEPSVLFLSQYNLSIRAVQINWLPFFRRLRGNVVIPGSDRQAHLPISDAYVDSACYDCQSETGNAWRGVAFPNAPVGRRHFVSAAFKVIEKACRAVSGSLPSIQV